MKVSLVQNFLEIFVDDKSNLKAKLQKFTFFLLYREESGTRKIIEKLSILILLCSQWI